MKKIVCLVLIGLLFASSAWAAEWPEGLGPSQPYANVPEVNLAETMGYIVLYPRTKIPANNFCDVLRVYLPREDLRLGEGSVHLYSGREEIESISFADGERVALRKMSESELNGLMWGGGTCIEIWLTVSLKLGGDYYVLMDPACFTTEDGGLRSRSITSHDAWVPVVNGDYGVSELAYTAAAEEGEEAASGEYRVHPRAGDQISFELVLGGDAAVAVIFSENDSVAFDQPEYTESGVVTGAVTRDPVNWGVVFLDEAGNPLQAIWLGR